MRLAGLIIDVWIAFLVKLILRFWRSWGSSKWEVVKARIDAAHVGGGWVWNCPTTEIGYTYDFQGQTYRSIDTKPFLMDSSAQAYVGRFGRGQKPFVRVDPIRPERSVLRASDQASAQLT